MWPVNVSTRPRTRRRKPQKIRTIVVFFLLRATAILCVTCVFSAGPALLKVPEVVGKIRGLPVSEGATRLPYVGILDG